MGEPGRKHEKAAVFDLDHHLIRVLGGEFGDRWADDPRLRPGVVETDSVGAIMSA